MSDTEKPWDLPPGLELDEVVGRALGVSPQVEWMVSDDGGKSLCAATGPVGSWNTKGELEEWLAEQKRAFPGHFAGHEILRWEIWPYYSIDDSAAMSAARMLPEHGFAVSVFWDRMWACAIRRLGTEERVCEMCQVDTDPDSPALAISRAIVAADQRWPGAPRGEERDGR